MFYHLDSYVKARRELRAMKGLVRLKSLMHGNSVKRQATTTLRSMQTLARVQSQILSRRMRLMEENQVLQRQMLLKHERDLENLKVNFWIQMLLSCVRITCSDERFCPLLYLSDFSCSLPKPYLHLLPFSYKRTPFEAC